ncbi:ABC transporter permease [Paraburkholderia terrae]|uniref:ABC transporter permease n=1 Tax=Paraburkholderia terrae TaxID=311230 RepID=UPI0030E26310
MQRSFDLELENGASALPAPPGRAPRKNRHFKAPTLSSAQALSIKVAFAVVSIGVVVVLWYLGTRYRVQFYIRFQNVPTPYDVFREAVHVVGSDAFAKNIGNSLRRIFAGFALAVITGVGLGLMIGRYRIVSQLLMPAIEVLRPIPAIAWVPMSIMLWPTTESSIVFITFIGAFYPILLNTVDGVESLDGVLMRAGRCLGASEAQLFWHVILPGVLPNIFTGLAVGMGVAWVSLIAAEMISGQYGVGYYTWEAYSLVNYPAIVLGMITIGALGLLCSGAIRLIGQVSMPWLAYVNGARK